MRLRTVAVSAVLVLGAGLTATACSSSENGPASEGTGGHTVVRPAAADATPLDPTDPTDPDDPCAEPLAEGLTDEADCVVEFPEDLVIEEGKPAGSERPHLP
ncbi:hypothetical protein [Streptomyces sp. SID11385]|uniref:hypothetical protein n=1 Tax=Streptomyces sp. SID11385 TaxID=2706031 RepID=UPI0013CA01B0|nr:hypothetical protein [Streptomyces sp. SID11385]NEA41790.1 hypothetical protein [Streptomyces sp. SID11385]